jgi:hypothetical protein
MNSISFFKALLMKELNEKDLPGNQERIAQAAEPKDKITAADFAALRAKKNVKKEGEDHEVSMANNSIESIIKAAMELKAKMGDQEKDIPAWIQDHITNAANYISQASDNYHEYSEGETGEYDMDELPDGTEEVPAGDAEDLQMKLKSMMEGEFISIKDFSKNLELYKKGNIIKSQLINSYNKLSSDDQDKAKELAKGLDILPNPKKTNEISLQSMMEDLFEAKKKKPSAGLSKKQKSAIVKKAKSGKDMGKKGKGFEKIVKAAKKSGADNPEAVAGAAFWKGQAKKAK